MTCAAQLLDELFGARFIYIEEVHACLLASETRDNVGTDTRAAARDEDSLVGQ
jgi:hypothetical protein